LLKLSGPGVAALGVSSSVTVVDGKTGSAVAGATIAGAPGSPTTGGDGGASVVFDSPGVKRLKAEAPGAIRSNALLVCVPALGAADCGPDTPRPTAGSGATTARDARAPTARISSPRDGVRYRRGVRILRGRATDEASGIAAVELALRHHLPGKKCRWWSARSERFVGGGCRKPRYFSVGNGERWSYLLPKALPRGRYLVEVRARDRAGNREQRFDRGRNRIGFSVTSARLRKAARSSRRRPGAPTVHVLVVGKDSVLASADRVRAGRRAVRASGRRCLVPASTPLAALDARLATEHVGYHARDFGRCSPRTAGSSRQLFVDRIARDRNRGRNGWFYKLNDLAGTAGGADPSGIPGGRLRKGDRVLWFFCRFDAAAGSCQRSLRITLADRIVRPGAQVAVRVRGYDNEARGRPASGASVGLGALSALADSGGKATLAAPGTEGNYVVTATAAGAVPAFPVALAVRTGGAES
jgi:hypothetical protein